MRVLIYPLVFLLTCWNGREICITIIWPTLSSWKSWSTFHFILPCSLSFVNLACLQQLLNLMNPSLGPLTGSQWFILSRGLSSFFEMRRYMVTWLSFYKNTWNNGCDLVQIMEKSGTCQVIKPVWAYLVAFLCEITLLRSLSGCLLPIGR